MNTKIKAIFFAAFIFAILMVTAGCGGEDPINPQHIDYNNAVLLAEGTLGPQGGILAVQGQGDKLDGISLNAPVNSLGSTFGISIFYYDVPSSDLPNPEGLCVSKVVRLKSEALLKSQALLKITLPYDKTIVSDPRYLMGAYFDPDSNVIWPVTICALDEEEGLISLSTCHLGDFAVFYDNKQNHEIQSARHAASIECDFKPEVDGFLINNFTSCNFSGACLGMAAYSAWYYGMRENGSINDLPLNGQYHQGNPWEPIDDIVAHEVAIRAQNATEYFWSNFQDLGQSSSWWIKPFGGLGDSGIQIMNILSLTHKPCLLLMRDFIHNPLSAHAVTVYKYDGDTLSGKFYFYDSNSPNQICPVDWNILTGFGVYKSQGMEYTHYAYDTLESFVNGSEYNAIYNEAKGGFSQNPDFPELEVTSHINGQIVNTEKIELQGMISPNCYQEKDVVLYLGMNGAYLSDTITFPMEVSLETGENRIWLLALNKPPTGDPQPYGADLVEMVITRKVPDSIQWSGQVWVDQMWQGTGIQLESGTTMTFTASGLCWFSDPHGEPNGPEGQLTNTDYPIFQSSSLVPTVKGQLGDDGYYHFYALVAKVGDGEAVYVGAYRTIIADTSGELFLAANDQIGLYGDNTGYWDVHMERQ